MYVLEVVFGGTAEGTFGANTTHIIAADKCIWTYDTSVTDGYKLDTAKIIMGYNGSSGAGVANGAFDFTTGTSGNSVSIKLGYVAKTGRFVAITN